ncbi:MAG: DNA repair protein RecO [Bacteroidota bacterium]
MLIKTRGIIFRSIKYSETSIISDIFTEQKGLRTYIISGVRKKNARVSASLLQVMSLVDLVVYHRDDKDMTRIKEIKAAHIYQSLPFDIVKSSVGQFMLELTRKAIREPEENEPLFNFVFQSFLSGLTP